MRFISFTHKLIFWDLAIKENVMSTGGEGFHTNSSFLCIEYQEVVWTPHKYLFCTYL